MRFSRRFGGLLTAMLLAIQPYCLASPASADPSGNVTLFAGTNLSGPHIDVTSATPDLRPYHFNDKTMSIAIHSGTWQFCNTSSYGKPCVTLGPGHYPDLSSQGLSHMISSLRPMSANYGGASGRGITMYRESNERGDSYDFTYPVRDLRQVGFNDQASSVIIHSGIWQLCTNTNYGGRCLQLGPGGYPSLISMGFNDRISSMRPVTSEFNGNGNTNGNGITLYRHFNESGESADFTTAVPDLRVDGFADIASSVIVHSGHWQLCTYAGYRGNCITLGPGTYNNLRKWDLLNRVSSIRPI